MINNPCWGLRWGMMMDLLCCTLLWEQQWVRWSGMEEIRWLCPPRRSLSPRWPCEAAAPLRSPPITSHSPPQSKPIFTCSLAVTEDLQSLLFYFFSNTKCFGPWDVKWVVSSPQLAKILPLTPVSHLQELSPPVARGWGNTHQHRRHGRLWRVGNTQYNTSILRK